MEAIATGSLRELAAQGTGWTLFVVVSIAFAIYFVRKEAQIRADMKAREEIQEKRIKHVTDCMDKIQGHLAMIENTVKK